MPQRQARLAARRHFVEMKQAFMVLAAEIPGREGGRWQLRVRRAEDPADLLALQCDLIAALPAGDSRAMGLHEQLQSHLEHLFPDTGWLISRAAPPASAPSTAREGGSPTWPAGWPTPAR